MCNIPKASSDDLDISAIARSCGDLAKFGVGYVFLQGGEPLMRKDLFEIIDRFILNGIKPTIITNGLLLSEEIGENIAKRWCNLAISLDSLDPAIYKRMRGVDELSTVMRNIKALSKIQKRKGNWALTSTITKLITLQDVKRVEAFAHEHGFMYAVRPYVFVRGVSGRFCADLVYSYEDVKDIYDYMLASAHSNNYLASLIYEEHIKYIKKESMVPCDANRYSFVFKTNGFFCPCLEFRNVNFPLEEFEQEKKKYAGDIEECNDCSPCFYNDAREIGILWRNKWRVLAHSYKIIFQLKKYGNFF